MNWTSAALAALIRAEAVRQGVEPMSALHVAAVESGFRNVIGDKGRMQTKAKQLAARGVISPANRWLDDKSAWSSYGPMQLSAVWYTRGTEDPTRFADPRISVPVAVRVWKKRLQQSGANPMRPTPGEQLEARIRYVCGSLNCSDAKKAIITRRWAEPWKLPKAPGALAKPPTPTTRPSSRTDWGNFVWLLVPVLALFLVKKR